MEDIKQTKTLEASVQKPKKKKKKGLSAHKAATGILIVGIIIILIPCGLFGYIIYQASKGTGVPVEGNRFENALDPAIVETNINNINTKISSINQVESVDVYLATGQLRVSVDCKDTLDSDTIKTLCEDVLDTVSKELPLGTYFKSSASKRMYDLSIVVYNFADDERSGMICWEVQKNSQMENPTFRETTKAIDEQLARELRGEAPIEEVEEPQEEGVEE